VKRRRHGRYFLPHRQLQVFPLVPASPSQPQSRPSPPPAPGGGPPAVGRVLDVPLALTDYGATLDWVDEAVASGARAYVCVAAVHTVVACQDDPELRAAVLGADFTVPDGQPLVWALNLLGHRLRERVYGPELMDRACARAARDGTRFYLYGGHSDAALDELARALRARHPGLRVVGGFSPPFRALTEYEEAALAADVARSGADVLWVGIGVPKQETFMARMRPILDVPVMLGVGAAFDFHAGRIPQAPALLQRAGLEWLFRLSREPRRLWRRYLAYNPRFVTGFARQYWRHLRAPRP
jgi:N-acetylglucosaminyldiphosphoundecaprenol N-acetyl-beta-D-mannosaminyltransferase